MPERLFFVHFVGGRSEALGNDLAGASKAHKVTNGRMLFCYLAVREMGISMTEIASRLKTAVLTVSGAVQKEEQVIRV